MNKNWFYLLLLVIVFAVGWLALNEKEVSTVNNSLAESKLNLSYQAEKEFDPEVAVLTLGVETMSKHLDQAFAQNSKKMEELTIKLNERENLEVNTLNFQVMPVRRMEEESEVTYYQVLNQLEVETEELESLGLIIQQAVEAGANQIFSIRYTLNNEEEAVQQVIEEALKGLEEKALYVAAKLDKDLGEIITLDLNDQNFNRSNYRFDGKGLSMDAVIPPVSPQMINVLVSVRAEYSLK